MSTVPAWARDDLTRSEVRSAQDCPEVFGSRADREAHRAHRLEALRLVVEGPSYIDVVHSSTWDDVTPIEYAGMDFRMLPDDDGVPMPVVSFDPPPGVSCPAGLYRVGVDDGLGQDAQVLAVLDGIVLVEHQNRLRYFMARWGVRPIWKLSWVSDYAVVTPSKGSATPRRSVKKRRPRRRR